ncbi:uracil phosphoribosyltransferase [Batrachochytrium salamandrivorans]|nr:uracil phosphoribosyltransferase [Batrachochytrium salamandrivorans]
MHKMSLLRDARVRPKQFRELTHELTLLLGSLATADMDLTTTKTLHSPLAPFTGVQLKDSVGVFPILRAGQGMVNGLYRETSTLLPVEYYNKLPTVCSTSLGFVIDPMIATAGTAIAAVNILKEWGLPRIKFVSILASRSGVLALLTAHPDIEIYVAAIDDTMNDHGYIIPGVGDAGDR